MFIDADGSIFDTSAEALVNPVNCVGVMGAGLALQFKYKFPLNFTAYSSKCAFDELKIGSIFVFHENEKCIMNMPTKTHYREPSTLAYIQMGLQALKDEMVRLVIHSIAIPALGCGLGGLDWDQVKPLICEQLDDLKAVRIELFGPKNLDK